GLYVGLVGTGLAIASPGTHSVDGLQCTPAVLHAGESATCTLTLFTIQGGTLSLSSSSMALTVPASLSVAAGSSTAVFSAAAGAFSTDQNVFVTASLNGASWTTSLALTTSLTVTSLACDPAVLAAGGSGTCTVTVSGTGGGTVALASDNGVLTVPASVPVASGSDTATFVITA